MRKKRLLIIVLAILVPSIIVTAALLHWGQEPSDGGVAEVPGDTTPSPWDTPTPEPTVPPSTPSTTLTIFSITEGDVSVMKAGMDTWIEAQVEMSLEVGDTIKTGNSSSAEITFFDGSIIELQAGTEIEVASLDISDTGSTTIRIKQAIGNTISRVKQLVDSASSYEVETPACVAAVRGSVMTVNVIDDDTTWVTNQEGDIWVIANGVELQIPEGRKCIIISGQPPQLVPLIGGGGGGGFSPNPDIDIAKTTDREQIHEGDTITYTYTVTNPGNVSLSNVSVTDDMTGYVPYQSGDTDNDGRLDTDETWIFTATYNVTADDVSPLVNNAAAAGTYAGSQIIAWDNASVDILRPDIALNKTADPVQARAGDTITYTYTVTNPGNTPLYAISVVDDAIEVVTYQSGDTNGDEILDMDETWIFTATHTVTAEDPSSLVNTATVYGTDALDQTVTAQATASVAITVDIPTYGIKIELTWNTDNTDMDAHFIRPLGRYWDDTDDCFWLNENPDWGLAGVTEDNPSLNGDFLDGYGPEIIILERPYEQGTYQYQVAYQNDHGLGPSIATVRVWINDAMVGEYSKEMSNGEIWHCVSIDWPSGQVTPNQG